MGTQNLSSELECIHTVEQGCNNLNFSESDHFLGLPLSDGSSTDGIKRDLDDDNLHLANIKEVGGIYESDDWCDPLSVEEFDLEDDWFDCKESPPIHDEAEDEGSKPLYEGAPLTLAENGCPIFKSSKVSLRPPFFSINELPHKRRFLKENLIYAGLWLGSKPAVGTFLKPFLASIKELQDGVEVYVQDKKEIIIVKAVVLCGTCDLPARAVMLNMVQFNGAFGCSHCLQKGCSTSTGKLGVDISFLHD
ncbi:hypothetical protein BSL78_10097 [Apostichopus japonicus]|uniref:Uncharacterized protein n=1 Tax=Stichopus japonicus TaxID=307972 RepID=A0A2G8KYD5_STIJA|nr:hypothetical protein BSL78_10097 [Apostichopus japonicus]